MPTPKLFMRQYRDDNGKTYIFYRYWDNHLENYEYQVYELKMAKPVTRILGAPELTNTREMCDWSGTMLNLMTENIERPMIKVR